MSDTNAIKRVSLTSKHIQLGPLVEIELPPTLIDGEEAVGVVYMRSPDSLKMLTRISEGDGETTRVDATEVHCQILEVLCDRSGTRLFTDEDVAGGSIGLPALWFEFLAGKLRSMTTLRPVEEIEGKPLSEAETEPETSSGSVSSSL